MMVCFNFLERTTDEVKRKYRLTAAEKRIIFAICDGCLTSPDLQVDFKGRLFKQSLTLVCGLGNL